MKEGKPKLLQSRIKNTLIIKRRLNMHELMRQRLMQEVLLVEHQVLLRQFKMKRRIRQLLKNRNGIIEILKLQLEEKELE